MPRAAARFRQSDIARALRAAKQADAPVAVEIAPDGTIRLVPVVHTPAPDMQPPKRREIVL